MTANVSTPKVEPELNPIASGRGHILLADHDALFREATAGLLRARGYACTCVASGPAVVERLHHERVDLLLADTGLSGNRGLDLIRVVRRAAAGLPIILISGACAVETAAESIRLSVVAYLTKPLDLDELCLLAKRAIARGRACRVVEANHQRLRDCCQDLQRLKDMLQRPEPGGGHSPWEAVLSLNLGHLMESLIELNHYAEALVRPSDPAVLARFLEASSPLVLVDAIRETVVVLERSKGAFKSRELGELRRRLQALLDSP